ncbi:MAG: hypothetical protein Q4G21_11415 [Dermabacter sp.]|nr:hypothetical protein [Dermabacter sp.]
MSSRKKKESGADAPREAYHVSRERLRAEARAAHERAAETSQSPSVHVLTVPVTLAGIIAGFFVGRLFGGILGGGIALILVITALVFALRRPDLREPALAGAGALLAGFVGVMVLWFLNS